MKVTKKFSLPDLNIFLFGLGIPNQPVGLYLFLSGDKVFLALQKQEPENIVHVVELNMNPAVLSLEKLGTITKGIVKAKMEAAIATLVEGGGKPEQLVLESAVDVNNAAAYETAKKIANKMADKVAIHTNVDAEVLDTGIVKLIKAKKLCQKVYGTSDGSVYYAIALGEKISMAVRLKKSAGITVSIRAEGVGLEEYKKNLESCGLNGSSAKHFSLHVKAADKQEAMRVVGAVVLGSGIPFKEIVQNLATANIW